MNQRLQHAMGRFLPAVFAGALLGAIEAGLVAGTRVELFLSIREFARFWLIVTCVAISLQLLFASATALIGQVLARFVHERFHVAVALLTGLCIAPLSAWLYWALTQGRRVRAWEYRAPAVSGAALLTSLFVMLGVLGVLRAVRAGVNVRRALFALLIALSAGALIADVLVLRRLYPAFHWALCVVAVLAGAAAVRLWPFALPHGPLRARLWSVLGIAAAMAAPFLLRSTQDAPNLRYAMEEAAPLSGKLLRALRGPARLRAPLARSGAKPVMELAPNQPGISLRGSDVLIITVDALRADRLRSYGSHRDLTPALDELATRSAVFGHAYTQTPHTSYAIGSLWTGKYLRPVLSLPGATRDHTTLPRILRRFGYRTAAFYPPAVFFVDEERFSGLAEDHFGFEYVKEMFAPAHSRVGQLADYLAHAEPGHPLLVWVHLFEPHEPYEPAPGYQRGNEPEQRYDGEVAAADDAAGQLIELFRSKRPGATVIVTADHGEEFGDHGGHHHGTTLFEEQVHVPLLWSSPGQVASRRIQSPVQLIDVAPTLLSALGIPRDPRMRGADLSGLLHGAPEDPRLRAFASIEELRMISDGAHKLICETAEGSCRLYDLTSDPSESRDASAAEPKLAARLGQELSDLVASIPEGEVMAMQSGDAWPKALARARLGDRAARDELLPLLTDARAGVRAETLRALAALHVTAGASAAVGLADSDPDVAVRDEAALAALTLGELGEQARVQKLLARLNGDSAESTDLARRAAFALGPAAGAEGEKVLTALAADRGASQMERERALATLGQQKATRSTEQLIALLNDVRLRPAVARALGQIGGKTAVNALLAALANERYPESRAAEVEALVGLRIKRALAPMVRFLGTETGLPGGLEQWAKLRGPGRALGGVLLDLRQGNKQGLHGDFRCRSSVTPEGPPGCRPAGNNAELVFQHRLPPGELRVVLTVWGQSTSDWVRVLDHELQLHRGRNELSLLIKSAPGRASLPMRASPGSYIELVGVMPRSPDIPPPAPEPYVAKSDDALRRP